MSKLQARNEAIINAPASSIWAIITDINVLHKVNPGVIKASGRMDKTKHGLAKLTIKVEREP